MQTTATAQSILSVTQSQVAVAQLTQTATLQGALRATVAAKQTSVSVMNTLPGRLVFEAGMTGIPVGPKVLVVPRPNNLTPDNVHVTWTEVINGPIYIANLDGSDKHILLDAKYQGSIYWAPDGKHYAFVDNNTKSLSLAATAGGEPKVVTPQGMEVGEVVWSGDNQHVAFVGSVGNLRPVKMGIYAVGADSGETIQTIVRQVDRDFSGVRWLPDNERLLYCAQVQQPKSSDTSFDEIQVVNRDGTNLRDVAQLQSNFYNNCQPALSANGKWVFLRSNDAQIYLLSTDTSVLRQTMKLPAMFASSPVWSPDGTALAGTLDGSLTSDISPIY